MKNLFTFLIAFAFFPALINAQADEYNLESKNLHKKVRKTRTHNYSYDENSGGFVLRSVAIDRYNDDGNLEETFYQYNGSYAKSNPTKRLYNYNKKEQLISTKDVSDKVGKYSTNLLYTYDRRGNLIKKESVYQDGTKYLYTYEYDRKKKIGAKEYNKENKLNSETRITYSGDKRTEERTSYNSKDGSIYGTYTTYYDDDVKVSYKSNSSYGTSVTKYTYDDENNLLKSVNKGEKTYITDYDYEYDKKDNWVKKHSRSGKFQSFYFREIIFDNGDITGNSDFDRNFINRHGNYANVTVVPLKLKESTTIVDKRKNTNTNTDSRSTFSNKSWNFSYAYSGDKIKKLTGTVKAKTSDNSNLKVGSSVSFNIKFNGQEFNLNFDVTDFGTVEKRYEYQMKNDTGGKASLFLYKKETSVINDTSDDRETFYVNGILKIIPKDGNMFALYVK